LGTGFLTYRKGVAAEQELMRLLKDRKYDAQRAAGSRGAADILAAKRELFGLSTTKFAIQVKSTSGDTFRISKEEIKRLYESAKKFGATPLLAVRFSGQKWRFWQGEGGLLITDDSELGALKSGKEPYPILELNDKHAQLFEKIF